VRADPRALPVPAASPRGPPAQAAAAAMLSPPPVLQTEAAAADRVKALLAERVKVVDKLFEALELDHETDGRLLFPHESAVKLHDERLSKIDREMCYLIKKFDLEDEDTDLDLVGRRGFFAQGDIVYTREGLACEVLSAALGRPAAGNGKVEIVYTVGKPKSLPLGVDGLKGKKEQDVPSSALFREPPRPHAAGPRPRKTPARDV